MKKNKGLKTRLGAVIGAGLIAVALSGCGSVPRATSDEKLESMRAGVALSEMDKDVESWRYVGPVMRYRYPELAALADAHKDRLEDMNDDIEDQISRASTPEVALREMVEDFSAYLLTELPQDADRRGLTEYRLNLAMGELINRDNDPRLYGALSLIRDNLVNNRTFSDRFRVLATTSKRQQQILDEITGADSGSLSNPGGEPVGYIDPQDLYAVEGETWIGREGYKDHTLVVYTSIKAFHPQTNSQVGATTISRSYYFHPIDGRFLTEDENNLRASSPN